MKSYVVTNGAGLTVAIVLPSTLKTTCVTATLSDDVTDICVTPVTDAAFDGADMDTVGLVASAFVTVMDAVLLLPAPS